MRDEAKEGRFWNKKAFSSCCPFNGKHCWTLLPFSWLCIFTMWKVRNWKVCTILRLVYFTSLFIHVMIISRLFCPILPKWMDCRMRLWLARRYHPRTVARCYQQRPTKCYQPTPRTGTMSLQIFLNSLTLSPQQCERWDISLNIIFVGMKRKALASLFIGHTLLCWLAEWLKRAQYQTAHWK